MTQTHRLLGSLALGLTLVACAPADPYQQVSASLAENLLLPAHRQWAESNQQLAASAQALCAGEQSLREARGHFLAAQQSWAALQPLLVGPMSEGNRSWQVQFWPDKKNLVARQVEQLLQRQPQLESLDKASVVVKGLSAYEYLLFDPALNLDDASQRQRYCPLLQAIGRHQAALGGEVLELWQAPQGMLAQLQSSPNSRYADGHEALGDLLRVQISALDGLKKKLGTPLGRQSRGLAQPLQAEAWRSQASLSNLAASLASAEALWHGSADDGVRSLLDAQHADLAERIDQAYAETRTRLAALDRPLAELLASSEGKQALDALYDSLDRLHRLQESELAAALQVQLGFNAHDGD